MASGIVFDIRRFSIHDGPGIRTAVFFKGCPLACSWCHNPEGMAPLPALVYRANRCIHCGACVLSCPQGAISRPAGAPLMLGKLPGDLLPGNRPNANGAPFVSVGQPELAASREGTAPGLSGDPNGAVLTDRDRCVQCGRCVETCYAEARELAGRAMSVADVLAEVERDVVFYDESHGGVTFSGGEPLLQAGFLLELARACREKGLRTALDTCGFAPWEVLDRVREYIQLFLYDVKLMDDARHRRFTGVSNALILENLRQLAGRGHRIVLRLPLIPGVNDDADNICATGALAAELHIPEVDLLPYHQAGVDKYGRLDMDYALPETRPPATDQVAEVAGMLREFGLRVRVGG
jgi:pyruvate formate lyase activating enzyme